MSAAENIFRFIVRGIFLFAYGAFLWASVHHIAYFYHNFEGTADWTGPYALAISIDVTSLVLAAGLMFFSRNMAWHTIGTIGFFVLFLTAFSWTVNWEYASHFQTGDLTASPVLHMLNPILASSFAFLNLAYSVVSGVFTARPKTAQELAKEADRLESLENEQKRIAAYQERNKKQSLIQRAKETAKEVKAAYIEVRNSEVKSFEQEQPNDTNENDDVGIDTGTLAAVTADKIRLVSSYPNLAPLLSTGRRTATIKEVAEATGYTEKWLRNRIEKRHIKVSSRNKNLLLIDSVIAWLDSLSMAEQNKAIKLATVASNNGTNGYHSAEQEEV